MLSNFHPTTGEQVSEQFEALIGGKQYGEIAKLGDSMKKDEFFKRLCPLISTLEHYKGLFERLQRRDLLPRFFIHGSMSLVRRAIIEVELVYNGDTTRWYYIRSAVILSMEEGRHDRFIGLWEAVQERFADEDKKREQANGPTCLYGFMQSFFKRFVPEENSMPLKRFLAMRGEELGEKHPRLFTVFFQALAWYLKFRIHYPGTKQLLLDLIGQPSLVAPIICAKTFLTNGEPYHYSQFDFIIYGCRESMAEGLKEEYPNGGRDSWRVITETFPDHFSGESPHSDEARKAVLERFKTKQQMEDEWGTMISPKLLGLLKELVPGLPTIPLNRIAKYLIPWSTFTQTPPQRYLVLQTREQVSERPTTLIVEERYWEVVRVCNSMSKKERLDYLCQVMSTLKHFNGLAWYLTYHDMHYRFLERGKMTLVREVISASTSYEYGYYIYREDISNAVIRSVYENRHDRAIDFLKAVQERYADEDGWHRQTGITPKFDYFMDSFMKLFAPEKNNVSDKLFLLLHREEFNSDCRSIFEAFCLSLVKYLKCKLDDPNARQLLIKLVGQPSLLRSKIFAKAFLTRYRDYHKKHFVTYGWREAIAEGLKEEYAGGGKALWNLIMGKFPDHFPRNYPPSNETLIVILANFKTKQQMEEECANTLRGT